MQLQIAHELIARFDTTLDFQSLSSPEAWLRRRLKATYLGLASLEHSIIRQRTCFACLKEGDASPTFFGVHVSNRKQKNHIFELKVGDRVVSAPEALADAAFGHFSNVFGTSEDHDFFISLRDLHVGAFGLATLDEPLSEAEIWLAIKALPSGKAPRPYGFIYA